MAEEQEVKIPKNNLVWVDPDEFNNLLDTLEDLIENYGDHDGECDGDGLGCRKHALALMSREMCVEKAYRVFRPSKEITEIEVTSSGPDLAIVEAKPELPDEPI